MKRYLILAILLLVVISVPAVVVMAQGPGEGGIVVEGSTRTSANLTSFVPIRCSGVDCTNPGALMFPALLAISPETQNWEIGYPGSLAEGVSISEDGLVYTFSLKQDAFWSDGEQITAEDVYFTWAAIQQGEAVGLSSSYAPIQRDVVAANVVDDFTIELSLAEASCLAFSRLALPVIPAHAYGFTMDAMDSFDWASMIEHPQDLEPTITAGPFQFNRLEPGTAIYLEANQSYFDAANGQVTPAGYVFLDVTDETIMIERFLGGGENEPNFLREPGTYQAILDAAAAGEVEALSAPGRVWHYVAVNTADPNNPQNGQDADGNIIDQGFHPIFGDVRVRQALQHAMNIEEIVNGPHRGNAAPMVAGTIPTAFTLHPELERRPYDVDAAAALLDEAGWVLGDDGVRVCDGCLYADPGTRLAFEMMNVGDIRNDVSIILQNQFAAVGAEVEVVVLDFNTMYDTNMGAQIFDTAVAGWRGALPFDPDQRSFFGSEVDIFGEGYGFNFGSFYNAEFEELGAQVNTLAGCDETARKEIAFRMQEILWEEQPYLWLYALNSVYSVNGIEGFDPRPNFGNWNADTWAVAQ